MTAGVLARLGAVLRLRPPHASDPGLVAIYEPRPCRGHNWITVDFSERHDYEECDRCDARRVMDLFPLDPPIETIDISWVCSPAQAFPAAESCTLLPAELRPRAEAHS